jgi:hypothetical protein
MKLFIFAATALHFSPILSSAAWVLEVYADTPTDPARAGMIPLRREFTDHNVIRQSSCATAAYQTPDTGLFHPLDTKYLDFQYNSTNGKTACCLWTHRDGVCAPGEEDNFLSCVSYSGPVRVKDVGSFEVRCDESQTLVLTRHEDAVSNAPKREPGQCLGASGCIWRLAGNYCERHCGRRLFAGTEKCGGFGLGRRCCCRAE